MPRGQLTKEIMKYEILKIKKDLCNDPINWSTDPKSIAHKYLNIILDKIEEYRV